MGLVTFLANFSVFFVRAVFLKKQTVDTLFICNMCAADFLMGGYLLVIAMQDRIFHGLYLTNVLTWVLSWGCQVTGILAVVSSELSVMILTCISIERFLVIVFPFKKGCVSLKRGVFVVITLWLVSLAIACLPVYIYSPVDFYGSNGMCFPLYIQYPYARGWEYSVTIFICLNALAMQTIIICYISIYNASWKSQKKVASYTTRDTSLAKRMSLIIMTDMACWIPILVVKVLALAHIPISPSVYGWLSIFVLPVNSAINPFLYTLSAPEILKCLNKYKCK
jgi:hypothetical protein